MVDHARDAVERHGARDADIEEAVEYELLAVGCGSDCDDSVDWGSVLNEGVVESW